MDLILDTHTLLWFLNGDEKLPLRIRHLIESEENTKYLSIASIWEIGIKMSLGKLIFPKGLEKLVSLVVENGFLILPITTQNIISVSNLEFIHRDPFDRIIVSQAKDNNFQILTFDQNISKYPVNTVW
ncbi:type II toxin-antitoxin system VapC family toxin [Cognataquiflexum aquatile]|jgi:PIN domain nuclease of toxin-antitoxin system|uniref:type II toxin-antitoxin system VapC family toxin n=1 Tax=Cognataquiflexum aquatile TaxID=2249427 RepID=UPI000DEA99A5|nr:type II toxin-antitoxin system VapC family toxin [Cognataquiflexum aquatile]